MKKVFMSLAIVAAMFAAASCAYCNNKPAEEPACCESCEKACCDSCATCDSAACAACDSTAADCAAKAE